MVIDNIVCLMDILDTAGQEEHSATREHCMRTGDGFLLVYSVAARDSFNALQRFISQIMHFKGASPYSIIVVGNKSDLTSRRQVATQEGKNLALSLRGRFVETSCVTRENVDEAFFELVREIRVSEVERGGSQKSEKTSKEKKGKARTCTVM